MNDDLQRNFVTECRRGIEMIHGRLDARDAPPEWRREAIELVDGLHIACGFLDLRELGVAARGLKSELVSETEDTQSLLAAVTRVETLVDSLEAGIPAPQPEPATAEPGFDPAVEELLATLELDVVTPVPRIVIAVVGESEGDIEESEAVSGSEVECLEDAGSKTDPVVELDRAAESVAIGAAREETTPSSERDIVPDSPGVREPEHGAAMLVIWLANGSRRAIPAERVQQVFQLPTADVDFLAGAATLADASRLPIQILDAEGLSTNVDEFGLVLVTSRGRRLGLLVSEVDGVRHAEFDEETRTIAFDGDAIAVLDVDGVADDRFGGAAAETDPVRVLIVAESPYSRSLIGAVLEGEAFAATAIAPSELVSVIAGQDTDSAPDAIVFDLADDELPLDPETVGGVPVVIRLVEKADAATDWEQGRAVYRLERSRPTRLSALIRQALSVSATGRAA